MLRKNLANKMLLCLINLNTLDQSLKKGLSKRMSPFSLTTKTFLFQREYKQLNIYITKKTNVWFLCM